MSCTVRELIDILQEYPEELEVYLCKSAIDVTPLNMTCLVSLPLESGVVSLIALVGEDEVDEVLAAATWIED